MTKYRIIECSWAGKTWFRVQKKAIFRWRDMNFHPDPWLPDVMRGVIARGLDVYGRRADPTDFSSKDEAIAAMKKFLISKTSVKWRVVFQLESGKTKSEPAGDWYDG